MQYAQFGHLPMGCGGRHRKPLRGVGQRDGLPQIELGIKAQACRLVGSQMAFAQNGKLATVQGGGSLAGSIRNLYRKRWRS